MTANSQCPYAVQCSGKQLAPGKYSVLLRSDGKVGHGVLKSTNQSVEIRSVAHLQGFKRSADEVVVGSEGTVRTLSAIQISGVNFVFDPIFTVDNSSSSKKKRVETTAIDTHGFQEAGEPGQPVRDTYSFSNAVSKLSKYSSSSWQTTRHGEVK
jgi:hypothetical protein